MEPLWGRFAPVPSERLRSVEDEFRARSEGDDKQHLVKAFAEYEMNDLRTAGASEAEALNYEVADPSYMAVPAAIRYWSKHEAVEESKAGNR